MADSIKPTPRNALLGWLADRANDVHEFASKPFGYDNPPGNMLMNAFGVPDVASTLDRMSYGNALTTGRGWTTQARPEVTNALMAAAPVVAKFPRQAMGLAGAALGIDANALGQAATVWHGSPHAFSKFDAAKIGTGEGAQAYGHGLYLADAPEVSKAYMTGGGALQKAVTTPNVMIDGQWAQSMPRSSMESQAATVFANDLFGATIPEKAAKLRKAGMGNVADFLEQNAQKFSLSEGNLYKVDLPDEHIAKMLDWDKPLSQQPQAVKALRGVADRFPGMSDALQSFELGSSTGETIKSFMSRVKNPTIAAQALKDAGIPGIRYLDGGSRGAGAGSSNYVVFPGNENMLSILERNGQSIK